MAFRSLVIFVTSESQKVITPITTTKQGDNSDRELEEMTVVFLIRKDQTINKGNGKMKTTQVSKLGKFMPCLHDIKIL